MTEHIKETIERYVYDVCRRLPQKNRADVRRELEANIYDMLEARAGDAPAETDLEDVLMELGSPAALAAKYNDSARALIGGNYYDKYLFVLKIVLAAVLGGMAIATVLDAVTAPQQNALAAVGGAVADILFALLMAFAYVTLIFAILERLKVKLDATPWSVSDLKPVPREEAVVKKGESVAGIIFTVAVLVLFNFAPQVMGVIDVETGRAVAPIFDLDVWRAMLPVINLCFLLGIVREALCVAEGRYTARLTVAVVVLDVASLALMLSVLLNPAVWNADMVAQLDAYIGFDADAAAFFSTVFPTLLKGIWIFAMVIAFLTNSVNAVVKCVKYRAQ